ncbi:MAG: hypothetical protein AB7F89_15960 [Pirellulaceae bacterium]
MKHGTLSYLLLLLVVTASSGASCHRMFGTKELAPPPVFAGPPTLDEILYVINTNSARVQQLDCQHAAVTAPGVPATLRATLSLERPRRLRLRAKLLAGTDLDLGSNDQLFWVWSKHDPDRAMYYGYHDQVMAQGLPVGPDWLIESLGLLQLDPAGSYTGPVARPDQRVEVRAVFQRVGRPYTRVLVIDSRQGWVVEQHILDASGQNLATALCSEHRTYPDSGVVLPHRLQVQLPSLQASFQLEVDQFLVNQLSGDPVQLFQMPVYEGYQQVNLSAPPASLSAWPEASGGAPPANTPSPFGAGPPGPSAGAAVPYPGSDPRLSFRPTYRGL